MNVHYHCSDTWDWTKWCFLGRNRIRQAGLHAWWCLWWPQSQPPTRSLHKISPCRKQSLNGSLWNSNQGQSEVPSWDPEVPLHSHRPGLCIAVNPSLRDRQLHEVRDHVAVSFHHLSLWRPNTMLGTEADSMGTCWRVKEKSIQPRSKWLCDSIACELPGLDISFKNSCSALGLIPFGRVSEQ